MSLITGPTDVFARKDADALLDYRSKAPAVNIALPTHEHFIPSIVAMGTSSDKVEPVTFPDHRVRRRTAYEAVCAVWVNLQLLNLTADEH